MMDLQDHHEMASNGLHGAHAVQFPILSPDDLNRVAQTILHLYDSQTVGNPHLANAWQSELQNIQRSPEAWGLIAGLAIHEDTNVRFFSAHTAQVKISRDWETLPRELQPALRDLLLDTLKNAVSPANPRSHQNGNNAVVRKIFGSIASLILRLPFHLFPSPLVSVLSTISSAATTARLPPSLPPSGLNTPTGYDASTGQKMRSWGLEWLGICVEEIGRAGISDQKRNALRRHLEMDLPAVMETIRGSMNPSSMHGLGSQQDMVAEASAACRCAEAWIDYGLGADELTQLLPSLYNLLPLPAASSAIVEALSESIFKFGKGTKVLTEPIVAWSIGSGQTLIGSASGDPSDEVIASTKLLCALVEHSSEWMAARTQEPDLQTLLNMILRLTNWEGLGKAEETVSELTLPIYPLLQEAIMDAEAFQAPHETSPDWAVAKHFFKELITVTRRKVRWPDEPLDKEDRESFDEWRRDAGEVIVGAYYILRDEMLAMLVRLASEAVEKQAPWQDVEAILHCIRYSSEAVPLGEAEYLPQLFGPTILGRLAERPEDRLRLTVVTTIHARIEAYEEWFKFHPDQLLPVLSYLVTSLTTSHSSRVTRHSAEALKALCDICRKKLVEHISAFSELHGKIGDLGGEEQIQVIEGITSVIQALPPQQAIEPVRVNNQAIVSPVVDRLMTAASSSDSASLIQNLSALTACFKGMSPNDDDIFDLDEAPEENTEAIETAREDDGLVHLRAGLEQAIAKTVEGWNGDGEIGDGISSLIKNSTLSSNDTLISLSPLRLLTFVVSAAERAPSSLWMSLSSTLVLRINSPPSLLTRKKERTADESVMHEAEEAERWNVIGDAATRLVRVAATILSALSGISEHPDVAEAWFKFCGSLASRFPGVLLRLSPDIVQTYMSLGVLGLGAQERFSLKATCDFFVSLLATTRYPSPLEQMTDDLLAHFGPQVLRAILLSAGNEGPRSVIPNLAELLASFVQRVPGVQVGQWLEMILWEDGFPDPRATPAAKIHLKEVITRSRTTKKMREALHDFALVARGLDNTTYGNATSV